MTEPTFAAGRAAMRRCGPYPRVTRYTDVTQ
jgi:hypothetical protein